MSIFSEDQLHFLYFLKLLILCVWSVFFPFCNCYVWDLKEGLKQKQCKLRVFNDCCFFYPLFTFVLYFYFSHWWKDSKMPLEHICLSKMKSSPWKWENWWVHVILFLAYLLYDLSSWRGVLNTTLCDKVCQWLATGLIFSGYSGFLHQ